MPGSSFIPLLSMFFSLASIAASCSQFVYVNTSWTRDNLGEISAKASYLLSTLLFRLFAWVLIATYLESFSLVVIGAVLIGNLAVLLCLQNELDIEPILHSVYSLFFPAIHFSLFGKPLEKRQAWRLTAALTLAGNIILTLALLTLPVIGNAYFLQFLSLQVETGLNALPFVLFFGALSAMSLSLTFHSTFGKPMIFTGDLANVAVPAMSALLIFGTAISGGLAVHSMRGEELILPQNTSCYNPGLCKARPIHISGYENIEDCITQCQNFDGCQFYGILTDTKQCILTSECARVTMAYKKDRSNYGTCGKLVLWCCQVLNAIWIETGVVLNMRVKSPVSCFCFSRPR